VGGDPGGAQGDNSPLAPARGPETHRPAAAGQSVTADELAARVLAEHIPARRKLGFVALGASNSGGTAAEAEELLAEGFGR
jgi:hypothetical protein